MKYTKFFIVGIFASLLFVLGCTPEQDEVYVPADWETYSDSKYIMPQSWPPEIKVDTANFLCAVDLTTVNGRDYCIISESEGAAGSLYIDYTYLRNLEEQGVMMSIEFALKFPQCANYDEPEKSTCESEQADLDLNNIIDQIAESVEL